MSQPYVDKEVKSTKQNFIGNPSNAVSRILALQETTGQPIRPIILVPDEIITGNLNTENAFQFLSDGKYQILTANSVIKKKTVDFSLDLLESRVNFEILDDITSLKHKNKMNQVAAIFIKGNAHQFKDIQDVWGISQIAKLFKKVRSYFLTYADVPIHPEVQKWNVKILKIDRFARHKDLIVQQEFLSDFRSFLLSMD